MTDEQLTGRLSGNGERRRGEQVELVAQRPTRAWEAAHVGARILRERFGVSSVIVFGSLAEEEWFGATSDIDLAASGLQGGDVAR